LTEQAGTFIKWIDKKRNIALISFTGPEPIPAQENLLYDYILHPCSHKVMNKTYQEVEIDGHMYCEICKKVRQIESLKVKRF